MHKRPADNTEHTKKNNIIKCYILIISRLHNNGEITTEKQQYNNGFNRVRHLRLKTI